MKIYSTTATQSQSHMLVHVYIVYTVHTKYKSNWGSFEFFIISHIFALHIFPSLTSSTHFESSFLWRPFHFNLTASLFRIPILLLARSFTLFHVYNRVLSSHFLLFSSWFVWAISFEMCCHYFILGHLENSRRD